MEFKNKLLSVQNNFSVPALKHSKLSNCLEVQASNMGDGLNPGCAISDPAVCKCVWKIT